MLSLYKLLVGSQDNKTIINIYNTSSNDNFVCSNCKKKVIICNLKNNNVQTKDLKNKHNDDPLDDIYDIFSIINFLSYKP